MDSERLKRLALTTSRMLGVFLLFGVLIAACGDDDDDDVDISDELNGTESIELTPPEGDAGTADDATSPEQASDATVDMNATGTEDDESATGTEDDENATGTESDDDATGTEDEDDATETEESGASDATGTEDDDTTGTATEDADDGTPTEDDDTGTATEDDDDMTATESTTGGTASPTEGDTASGTTTPASDDTGDSADIGESIEFDNLIITVDGAAEFFGVPGVLEPDDDMRFIAVEVTVENAGSEPLSVIDLLGAMHVETGDGEEYEPDILAIAALFLENGDMLNEDIQSGDNFTQNIAFEVPEDSDELTLVIELDDDDETVRVDLSGELS